MVDYGRVNGVDKPKPMEVTSDSVFIASDITPMSEELEDGSIQEYFEYDYMEYTKDEYIELQESRNNELEQRIDNTQMAMCEIYESINMMPTAPPILESE